MKAPSPVESEIKLRVADLAGTRAALIRLGVQPHRARVFEDNIVFDRHDTLRSSGLLLRLRRSGEEAVLTFKGQGEVIEGIKVRAEKETAVADAEGLEAILEALGYDAVFRYQKYRETFSWRGLTIVLDETPVGSFLEIEGSLEEIHEAAAALGAKPSDYIAASYAQLFRESGGSGDMVFPGEAKAPR